MLKVGINLGGPVLAMDFDELKRRDWFMICWRLGVAVGCSPAGDELLIAGPRGWIHGGVG